MTVSQFSNAIPCVFVERLLSVRMISIPVDEYTFAQCEILVTNRESNDSPIDITHMVSDFIPREIQSLVLRKSKRSEAGTSIPHQECENRFQLINESVVRPVGVRYSLKENV